MVASQRPPDQGGRELGQSGIAFDGPDGYSYDQPAGDRSPCAEAIRLAYQG